MSQNISLQKPLSFSVIIPARNEERDIARCLHAIHESALILGREPEIILVLNRCTDKTEEIARTLGAKILCEDSKNLARIRNAGCFAALGDVIVTVDADSRVSKNMLVEIERVILSGRYAGGAVLILPERWSLGIIVTSLMLLPIAIWHRISGGVFYCLKSDFVQIGGFNEELCTVEDIDFGIRLRAHARRTGRKFKILLRAHIVTSCRKFDHFGDWYMIRNPAEFFTLLKGRNQKLADKIWYDFPR